MYVGCELRSDRSHGTKAGKVRLDLAVDLGTFRAHTRAALSCLDRLGPFCEACSLEKVAGGRCAPGVVCLRCFLSLNKRKDSISAFCMRVFRFLIG
jgi:hypothetical protein